VSADKLRRAADLLRQRAAAATPGPWTVTGQGPGPDSVNRGCGQVWTTNPDLYGGDIAEPSGDCYPRSGYSPRDDMTWIATVGPDVGAGMAAALDRHAEDHSTYDCNDVEPCAMTALADLILAGA